MVGEQIGALTIAGAPDRCRGTVFVNAADRLDCQIPSLPAAATRYASAVV